MCLFYVTFIRIHLNQETSVIHHCCFLELIPNSETNSVSSRPLVPFEHSLQALEQNGIIYLCKGLIG